MGNRTAGDYRTDANDRIDGGLFHRWPFKSHGHVTAMRKRLTYQVAE